MKSETIKPSILTFIISLFTKGVSKEEKTEQVVKDVQPLDIKTQYIQLYLDPTTSIRSRARDLMISRSASERLYKEVKHLPRNKRYEK